MPLLLRNAEKLLAVPVYSLDTTNLVVQRLSYLLNSVPSMVRVTGENIKVIEEYVNSGDAIRDNQRDVLIDGVVDLLSIGKQSRMLLDYLDQIPDIDAFHPKTVFQAWYIENTGVSLHGQDLAAISDKFPSIYPFLDTNGSELGRWIQTITSLRAVFMETQTKITRDFNYIQSLPEVAPLSSFQLTNIVRRIVFSFGGSLSSVFNAVRATPVYPCVMYNKYYKLLSGFEMPVDWTSSKPATVQVKIPYDTPSGAFTGTLIITGVPDPKNKSESIPNRYYVELDTSEYYDADMIMSEILAQVSMLPTYTSAVTDVPFFDRETNRKGVLTTPLLIQPYVLGDVTLLDPVVRHFFAIDDNRARVKNDTTIPYVTFVNPYDSGEVLVQCSITRDIAKDSRVYPLNQEFTRIYITKSTNAVSVSMFQYLLKKILSVYSGHENSIVRFYADLKLGNGHGAVSRKLHKKKPFPKDIEPHIFEGAIRKFGSNKIPQFLNPPGNTFIDISSPEEKFFLVDREDFSIRSIPEHDVGNYSAENILTNSEILMFPRQAMRYDPETKEISMDDDNDVGGLDDSALIRPRFYTCKYAFKDGSVKETEVHIGLASNKASSLGIAPCCFKTKRGADKSITNYFNQDAVQPRSGPKNSGGQVYFKKSDKIVGFKEYGLVNSTILDPLFSPDQYIRRGVRNSPSSFLECVMTALQITTREDTPDQVRDSVSSHRRSLLAKVTTGYVCAQELFQLNDVEIKLLIDNERVFLDPRYFIRVVEMVYRCNVMVFERTPDNSSVQLQTPRYQNGRVSFLRDDALPTILIYQHSGSESDALTEPHCELIVPVTDAQKIRIQDTKTDFLYTLATNVNIVSHTLQNLLYRRLWGTYEAMNMFGFREKSMTQLPRFLLSGPLQPVAQYLDPSGKVRYINVMFEGRTPVTIETSPLPPLNLKTTFSAAANQSFPIYPVTEEVALDIFSAYRKWFDAPVIHVRSETQRPSFIEAWAKDQVAIRFRIRIASSNFKQLDLFRRNQPSQYGSFIVSEKQSRYLFNWLQFLFSHYLADGGAMENFNGFISDAVRIDSAFLYKPVTEFMSLGDKPAGIFNARGLLVCTSNQLLNNLVYHLHFMMQRNPTYILQFKNRVVMHDYFTSTYDYYTTPQNNSIFYFPEKNVKSLTQAPETFPVFSGADTAAITTNLKDSFFYTDPIVTEGQTHLVRSYENLPAAVNQALAWQIYHTISPAIQPRSQEGYLVFVFQKDKAVTLAVAGVGDAIETATRVLVDNDRFMSILKF